LKSLESEKSADFAELFVSNGLTDILVPVVPKPAAGPSGEGAPNAFLEETGLISVQQK